LAPKYLGIKAIIAKSFARIHMANLVNFGILPLTFEDKKDYDTLTVGDELELNVNNLSDQLVLSNKTKSTTIKVRLNLSSIEKQQILAGGKLSLIRAKQNKK
jgi:aconitate hydratase